MHVKPKYGISTFQLLDRGQQPGIVGSFARFQIQRHVSAVELEPFLVQGGEHGGDVLRACIPDARKLQVSKYLGLLCSFELPASHSIVKSEELE